MSIPLSCFDPLSAALLIDINRRPRLEWERPEWVAARVACRTRSEGFICWVVKINLCQSWNLYQRAWPLWSDFVKRTETKQYWHMNEISSNITIAVVSRMSKWAVLMRLISNQWDLFVAPRHMFSEMNLFVCFHIEHSRRSITFKWAVAILVEHAGGKTWRIKFDRFLNNNTGSDIFFGALYMYTSWCIRILPHKLP